MIGRGIGRTAVALVLVAGVTACGDARFKKLSEGIGKDSVAALSGGAVAHRVQAYITGGKLWEVAFFAKPEVKPADSVAWREMTPVVYANDKVAGWGWSYWEKEAATLHIPLPK